MRHAIGVDIGGTKIRTALVSDDGAITASRVTATPMTAAELCVAIDTMIAEIDGGRALSIGIGVPGRVNASTGKIFSGGFVDLSGPPFAKRLTQVRGRPVYIDNDAGMALMAEAKFGAAKGLPNVVLLTIGTGIGGAIMADGRILHGRATAGQLGHISVDANGAPCLCGRRGCIETTSSGTALRRLMTNAGLADSTSVGDLLHFNDTRGKSILRDWAQPLRAAIDSLVAALDPDLVVLGGGLGEAAVRALADFPTLSPWYQCTVAAAELGDNAGVIGAAVASLESPP
jgi:glucokinase